MVGIQTAPSCRNRFQGMDLPLALCTQNAYSSGMNQEHKPINRLNDVLMKYVFAREDQKAVTLSLINAVFAAGHYALLEDFQFLDRQGA